ncbi:MAG: MFS transporter [Rickettsiaceae bacterium]|nr:MFS transporter [Rickettsiaceae bacterium]
MRQILAANKSIYIWILGFTSGFTLLLAGGTLNFWLASQKVDLTVIGLFSLTNMPYAIKFLWAPFFDQFRAAKSKIIILSVIHFLLILSLFTLGSFAPDKKLLEIAICSFIISLLSASQDIVLGDLRINILKTTEHGTAGGVYNFGYRMGMVFSGSGAIYLSDFVSWGSIYNLSGLLLAALSLIISAITLYLQQNKANNNKENISEAAYKDPNHHYSGKSFWVKSLAILLVFLVWYRLADDIIAQMLNPFLLNLGYSNIEIATLGKLCGTIGTMIGSIIASKMMQKMTITDGLLYFGIYHCLAHTLLIVQYFMGKNTILLFFTIAAESITAGMSMAAYMALITASCYGKWRGTQYSLLTSMMGLSRSILPSVSGIIVSYCGWEVFLCLATVITLPSLWLIKHLPHLKINHTKST